MEYESERQVYGFVSGLLLGAIIGAGVALLAAPDSGRRTRRRIRKVAVGAKETAADHWDEFSTDMKDKVDDAVKVARSRLSR